MALILIDAERNFCALNWAEGLREEFIQSMCVNILIKIFDKDIQILPNLFIADDEVVKGQSTAIPQDWSAIS